MYCSQVWALLWINFYEHLCPSFSMNICFHFTWVITQRWDCGDIPKYIFNFIRNYHTDLLFFFFFTPWKAILWINIDCRSILFLCMEESMFFLLSIILYSWFPKHSVQGNVLEYRKKLEPLLIILKYLYFCLCVCVLSFTWYVNTVVYVYETCTHTHIF